MKAKQKAKKKVAALVAKVNGIEAHVREVLKTEFDFDAKYIKLGDPNLDTITGIASSDNKEWYPFELGDRGATFGSD